MSGLPLQSAKRGNSAERRTKMREPSKTMVVLCFPQNPARDSQSHRPHVQIDINKMVLFHLLFVWAQAFLNALTTKKNKRFGRHRALV